MTEYKDKTIKCVDCGTEFTFTAMLKKVLLTNQKDVKLVVIRKKLKEIIQISTIIKITNYINKIINGNDTFHCLFFV